MAWNLWGVEVFCMPNINGPLELAQFKIDTPRIYQIKYIEKKSNFNHRFPKAVGTEIGEENQMKRAFIRLFGCILSAIGLSMSYDTTMTVILGEDAAPGAAWASGSGSGNTSSGGGGSSAGHKCTNDTNEVFIYDVLSTMTWTVGWNAPNGAGAFKTLKTKLNNVDYVDNTFTISGEGFDIPADSYTPLDSTCYSEPSAMTWLDTYGAYCDTTVYGNTLHCLYTKDDGFLYSPSTSIWQYLGCQFVSTYGAEGSSGAGTGSGAGGNANCFYTYASGSLGSEGPHNFIVPILGWNFSGCSEAGYYVKDDDDLDLTSKFSGYHFYTVPVPSSDSMDGSCEPSFSSDRNSICDRHMADGHEVMFLGVAQHGLYAGSIAGKRYVGLWTACSSCPNPTIYNNDDYDHTPAMSAPGQGITGCSSTAKGSDASGKFDIVGMCAYRE